MVHYQSINRDTHTLEERENAFRNLPKDPAVPHVFLQTCNRIERYEGTGDIPEEVSYHLFRVAAGLESGLTGEQAILGQVKEAYQTAKERYTLSAEMHKLFLAAITAGKRVRTETAIAQGAVSHSLAAIEILQQEQIDLAHSIITVIGVNKLTDDILLFLKNKGAQTLFLANRSLEKARPVAGRHGCHLYPLEKKKEILSISGVVISATSAPHTIIRPDDLDPGRPVLLIDLAFPRDIDPATAQMKGVKLFNLETIEKRIRTNLNLRKEEIRKAERILREEIRKLNETLERRKRYL